MAPGLVGTGLDDVVEVGPGLVVGPALIHVCVRRLSRVPKNLVSLEWGCASFTDRAVFALFVCDCAVPNAHSGSADFESFEVPS